MSDIHILEDHVANQIAAGEVVERPASVVKELVENALDAKAKDIRVTLEEGGLSLIRVLDHGEGIVKEDACSAFERHATSKIRTGKDLFQIRTLGFRGEALPSIAAVSKVSLRTSTNTSGLGTYVSIEGGEMKAYEECAADKGTDVIVKDLFFNTPARLKYMKTIQTELGHVSDYLYRLALARPDVAISFYHNGKRLLQTMGNGDVKQVIAAVYGRMAAKSMVPVKGETIDYQLDGLISRPEFTRAGRQAISLFINGRFIRHYPLLKTIMQGYHTLLPLHRYPIVILTLQMDPALVDVNVHPSKLEARFSKEPELLEFVQQQVKAALDQHVLIPEGNKKQPEKPAMVQEKMEWPTRTVQPPAPQRATDRSETFTLEKPIDKPTVKEMEEAVKLYKPVQKERKVDVDPSPSFPLLLPIGQLRGTYIIAQNEEGMFLIDQHAAHERIHYEEFYEKFGSPSPVSQDLLLPITLEWTPTEADLIAERLPYFEQIGIFMQPFGGSTFKVTSYPYWLPKGDEAAVIQEVAQWILEERKIDLAKLREQSAILCSCKASIKANQKLSMEEIQRLIERLSGCKQPYTCPHGRPIIVRFSNYELEKMFKRVM